MGSIETEDTFMIFRQKCVCVLIFTISILIVTGCEEFTNDRYDEGYDLSKHQRCLYEQIGRLNMELDWLKKKAASSG